MRRVTDVLLSLAQQVELLTTERRCSAVSGPTGQCSPRVANLRAVFGGWPATAITTEAIRDYQRRRRLAAAAAATVNRETSALSRMFQLAVRSRQLAGRPVFPERLEENGRVRSTP